MAILRDSSKSNQLLSDKLALAVYLDESGLVVGLEDLRTTNRDIALATLAAAPNGNPVMTQITIRTASPPENNPKVPDVSNVSEVITTLCTINGQVYKWR